MLPFAWIGIAVISELLLCTEDERKKEHDVNDECICIPGNGSGYVAEYSAVLNLLICSGFCWSFSNLFDYTLVIWK